MKPVYITRVSSYFPNEEISNDEMEEYLGKIGNKPSKSRAIVLRNNGIKKRYYALTKDGKSTHTNAQIAANAVTKLFDANHKFEDLDILAAGTTSPDQLLPSHAAMIHGELGQKNLELISTQGACATSVQAMKYAFLAIAAGQASNAAVVGSEKFSSWMHANNFEKEVENLVALNENPFLAFEKDFLRWMLSDGAGAALLQDKPNENGELSFRIEWIEITSYANELDTCMYSGAIKEEDGSMLAWRDMNETEQDNKSVFALKQDTKMLAGNIVPKGGDFLTKILDKYSLTADDIDHWLPHMSSEFFKKQIQEYHQSIGFTLSDDKWFYNLPWVGNIGAASLFVMLDELLAKGKFKKGERIMIMVPESARFTYAYLYLTVV